MWREAGARCIQNVLIVALANDVNGGETDIEGQMADVTTVRSERQLLEINTGELAEADRGTVFKLHFGKTVLCRRNGNSLLDRRVHSGASPLRGSRMAHDDRALAQTQAHHASVRYTRKRWRLLSIICIG